MSPQEYIQLLAHQARPGLVPPPFRVTKTTAAQMRVRDEAVHPLYAGYPGWCGETVSRRAATRAVDQPQSRRPAARRR